ncbi:mCG140637, partial [Mus musculus]
SECLHATFKVGAGPSFYTAAEEKTKAPRNEGIVPLRDTCQVLTSLFMLSNKQPISSCIQEVAKCMQQQEEEARAQGPLST